MNRRKLITGKTVPERKEVKKITISTHCPNKWLFVDLETGHVWKYHSKGGYTCFGTIKQRLTNDFILKKEM